MYYYDAKVNKELNRLAEIAQSSAKYMAYAILAARSNDHVLQNCCIKASEALQNTDKCFTGTNSYLILSQKYATKSGESASRGYLTLASAYALMARCEKIAATSCVLRYCNCLSPLEDEQNDLRNEILQKYDVLLSKAESFLKQNKPSSADVLSRLVLAHTQYDAAFTEADHGYVSNLCVNVGTYIEGMDVTIPDCFLSATDLELPNQLWARALHSYEGSHATKCADFASEMMNVSHKQYNFFKLVLYLQKK